RAQDFQFGTSYVLSASLAATYAKIVYDNLQGGEEYYEAGGYDTGEFIPAIKVLDDRTLEYHLSHPVPYFPILLAHSSFLPLNQKYMESLGDRYATSADTFLGNGPFKLAEHRPRDFFRMTKADTYWDRENIFWEEVILRTIEEESTEFSAFVTGE